MAPSGDRDFRRGAHEPGGSLRGETGGGATQPPGAIARYGGALQTAVALQHLVTETLWGFAVLVALSLLIEHSRTIQELAIRLLGRLKSKRRDRLAWVRAVVVILCVAIVSLPQRTARDTALAHLPPDPSGPKAELIARVKILDEHRSPAGVHIRGRIESAHEECWLGRKLIVRYGTWPRPVGTIPATPTGEWTFYHANPYSDLAISLPRWPTEIRGIGPANCTWDRAIVRGLSRALSPPPIVTPIPLEPNPSLRPPPEPARPDAEVSPEPVPPGPEPARPDPD